MKRRTITTRVNSNEAEDLDSIISDSYDSFVRLERRNLLATSTITLIASIGEIKPESMNLTLFELPGLNSTILFSILLSICVYFLIAFSIYAYPGFRASKKSWKDLTTKTAQITTDFSWYYIDKQVFLSNARYYLWLLFNFLLPVGLGCLAVAVAALEIA